MFIKFCMTFRNVAFCLTLIILACKIPMHLMGERYRT